MRYDAEKWITLRIRFIGGFFVLFFSLVVCRAFYLQVVKRDHLLKLADRQHQKIVPLTPARGTIYDANGSALAVSVEMDSCFAEPKSIADLDDAAARLSPVLGFPKETLLRKLQGNKNFVWLQRRLTPDVVKRIRALNIDGIGFVKETKRFYPNSEVAAHVIGFTGVDPEGLEGIELRYDSTILGGTGYLVTERDALGRDVALKGTVIQDGAMGHNVVLTLDKNIQYIAEKELAKAVDGSGARAGTAIVMDPHTGRVLAMANYPTFNLNAHGAYHQSLWRNRAVADSYEPGSTFKVFLIASALEEKVIRPGDRINCEGGSFSIGGRTIHDTHKYGSLSIPEILKYSSNIGSAKIGSRLGASRLYSYLRNFGFGARTGIDLPGEAGGTLRDWNQWYGIDLATVSFGQGVTASSIQLAAAFSAIANGGTLMKPYLVERVVDSEGNVIKSSSPQPLRRVVSETTAKNVARMMEGVAVEGGTGTNAAVEGFRVAGKTGTAQKVDPVTRGYSLTKRTASFIGFVPADRPRLTILVMVDEPKTSPYGGVVAAPAFSSIALQSLCYLKVPPDGIVRSKPKVVEAKADQPTGDDLSAAEGEIVDAGEGVVMPNFRGMSMRQALKTMEERGINVRLMGSGRAVEQSPLPGHRVGPSDQVWVKFVPSA
ncbi:transpeptidase family protein [Geobacter sulfurreducens]|jgi:cell division protein FtsI (penicillin-binding protein 3)|uniref:Peptidoglycan transglycosylase and transpeptidase FtsI n=1 Tax=Geobacter sulfurreducens (strain ATCC 51573 / DSM 12127 / PCA) TaxID=243231 RepID=Q748D1_GEOSL|nr:penicillin-binding protein [Geobacter sulfurreducens]AAR36466.1 peptidoglycan transglycosylase and transpeptidase FtsI [Geobacter sulfurreducens PCA]ADI85826.1 peptidoglycan transglycosylase and transpeptidase FtsI [Geobacter sulfurreducens KN400]QVW34873.1 transpeptidase family protein [Geobacter sulfurreducens]UAC03743.1 transpeptidase family protein [Geobacter sulfurreducens]UTG92392.1 transpeptidase family protein [Geobacter sulfurreducens]